MRRSLLCIVLVAAGVLASGPAAAAIDIFGKFTGIDGEANGQGHEKWIDVLSYSFGASNPFSFTAGPGGGQGKVEFSDFSFTKLVDKSSPLLLLDLAQGKMIDQALFDVVMAGAGANQQPFLQYKFSDVIITSYSVGGANGGSVPTENLTFAFGKIEWTYRPQDEKGGLGAPVTMFWDVKRNEGGISPVPEPSTWAMLAAGLAFVAFRGQKMVRARTA